MDKKLFIAAALLLIAGNSAMAQTRLAKGSHYASVSASFGAKNQETFLDGSSQREIPYNFEMVAMAGITYFIADNLSFSFNIGLPYAKEPVGQNTNGDYRYSSTFSALIGPEIRYYIPLTDRLYWMFTLSGNYQIGSYKEDTSSGKLRADLSGWQISFAPIGLEFIATDKISISMAMGGFTHASTSISANGTVKVNQNQWQLNAVSVSCNLWM